MQLKFQVVYAKMKTLMDRQQSHIFTSGTSNGLYD